MSCFHWLLCPVCHVLIGSLCSLISGVSFYVISHIYILFFLLFGEPCPGLCSVMFIVKPSSSHHLVLFMSVLFNKLHLDSQLYSLYLYISLSYIMLTTKICPNVLINTTIIQLEQQKAMRTQGSPSAVHHKYDQNSYIDGGHVQNTHDTEIMQ